MFEESHHICPSVLVILQLLKEARRTDYNVLALEIRGTYSVKLQHIAPLHRCLNLQGLQDLSSEQSCHQPDVILVSWRTTSECCLKECEEETDFDVFLLSKHLMEDVLYALKEQLNHVSILAVIVLTVHKGIQNCEHHLVQASNPFNKVILGGLL